MIPNTTLTWKNQILVCVSEQTACRNGSNPQSERPLRQPLAPRHHRCLTRTRIPKYLAVQFGHDPYRNRNQHQFEVKDRIREGFCGIGDQQQHARCGVDREARPHDPKQTLQRHERNFAFDTEQTQVDDGVGADQQCQAERVKQKNEIKCKWRLGFAQPGAESAFLDRPQE